MSNRREEAAGGVLSFTFLDVLMCTMGSLLLLLVVIGQRAVNTALAKEAARTAQTGGAEPAAASDAGVPDESLGKKLDEARATLDKIQKAIAEAADRRREERDRLAHSEDHQRRLEHELAKLHITLQQLIAAEQKQNIDEEQAKADADRLEQLVKETEAELAKQRDETKGKRSYAIIPYKGKSGTLRRPVFIECTDEAVTIQPEGIKFTVKDFDGPMRSGNPLAAAVRAAREELNRRAAASGQELPDAYPLLIVRPNGSAAYGAALSAVRSWDSEFGYEFVEADWKIEYPEQDPVLGDVMLHAADLARERQALLARAAPRRYASRLSANGAGDGEGDGTGGFSDAMSQGGRVGSHGGRGGGSGDGSGFERLTQSGGAGDRIGEHAGDGAFATGSGSGVGTGFSAPASGGAGGGSSDRRYGEITDGTDGAGVGDFADQASGGTGSSAKGAAGKGPPGSARAEGENNAAGQAGAAAAAGAMAGAAGGAQGSAGGGSTTGGASGGAMAAGATAGGAAAAGAAGGAGGAQGGGQQSAVNMGMTGGNGASVASSAGNQEGSGPQVGSAANSRGMNWANSAASRRSSAITRPIQITVRPDEMLVMPTDVGDTRGAGGAVITFHQPTGRVLDQLAGAVKEEVTDWGLAGSGMYWRPTLVLDVAPGAEKHAAMLAKLMENSGIDVRLPARMTTAQRGSGAAGGTRR